MGQSFIGVSKFTSDGLCMLVALGVVLSVVSGWLAVYVWSQQLVGTECLGVSQCS